LKSVVRLAAVLWCLFGSIAAVQAASVVFLCPGRSDETFWVEYAQFMQVAADSLGMELEVLYAERSRDRMEAQARGVLTRQRRPDFLVFVNEEYAAPEILRQAESSDVKLFMVHNALTEDQRDWLGMAREKYPNWIGSLVTNDEDAGELMAEALVREYRVRHGDGPVEMLAFGGLRNTPNAQARERGLQKALARHPEVRLRQLVRGDWLQARAYEQARLLLQRYPQIKLVWAANDQMAFGAMHALEELGGVPGKDVLFSALNNSEEVLLAKLDGRVTVLASGHFALGAWAMVLLHDYHAGLDFAERGGVEQTVQLFTLLDEPQALKMLKVIRQRGIGLDFRRFSAVGRPEMREYDFSLQTLVD